MKSLNFPPKLSPIIAEPLEFWDEARMLTTLELLDAFTATRRDNAGWSNTELADDVAIRAQLRATNSQSTRQSKSSEQIRRSLVEHHSFPPRKIQYVWMNLILYIQSHSIELSLSLHVCLIRVLEFGLLLQFFAAMADQPEVECRYDSQDPGGIALVCTQVLCAAALVVGVTALPSYFALDLIAHPVGTIRFGLALTLPTVIVAYTAMTMFSSRPKSVWRCVGGGLLSLPVGAILFALLALAFGAPTSVQYASRTLHWACLMSVLVVLPAAIVLGSSWPDWQRVFAFTRPKGGLERAVCIPAHGAVIGAWVGAFPMPLDWERPWQEWPISCTYGAAGGYLFGLTISIVLQCLHPRGVRSKMD